jgi:hypothetical protein
MIDPQFRLTGPSPKGISTELDTCMRIQGQGWKMSYALEPILDIVQLSRRYRVDVKRCLRKVTEDDDHVELLQAELHTLKRSDFDLVEGHDHEGWVR